MMKYWKKENGFSLLIVIFILAFISIVGLSLLTISANSLKVSSNERIDQSVYYIAEAGINYRKSELITALMEADKDAREAVISARDSYSAAVQVSTEPLSVPIPNYESIYREKLLYEFDAYIDTEAVKDYRDSFRNKFSNQSPYATVKVEKSDKDLTYKLISKGVIDEKTRIVESEIKVDYNFNQLFAFSSEEFITQGNNSNEKEDSKNNRSIYNTDIRLTTVSPPSLDGNLKNTPYATISDYSKSTDPVISFLYNEYVAHENNCKNPNQIPETSSKYDSISIVTPKTIDANNLPSNHTIYITGNVNLNKSQLTINVSDSKPVNLVICGELDASNGGGDGGSKLTSNKPENLNIFILGNNSDFNNIGVDSNYVFAPNLYIDFGGNIDLCTSIFVNSFTGKGGGSGGFTNTCSKGVDTSNPSNPKTPVSEKPVDNTISIKSPKSNPYNKPIIISNWVIEQ